MNVAFIIFRRPQVTRQVFETIRQARPERLFIIADGPRKDRKDEAKLCEETRSIVENVDWQCEVIRNYSQDNLGLKARVSTGLSWVFEQVSECIVLEDDCLPHPSFFRYCSEMLDRYRDDERIMSISGMNFQRGIQRGEYSYYFSKYFHCWGWASWSRAWRCHDLSMKEWPHLKETILKASCPNPLEYRWWSDMFDRAYKGNLDSWAIVFSYACWLHSRLNVTPNVNLISNIGFGPDGVHVLEAGSWMIKMPTEGIGEISHPPYMVRSEEADRFEFADTLAPVQLRTDSPSRAKMLLGVTGKPGSNEDRLRWSFDTAMLRDCVFREGTLAPSEYDCAVADLYGEDFSVTLPPATIEAKRVREVWLNVAGLAGSHCSLYWRTGAEEFSEERAIHIYYVPTPQFDILRFQVWQHHAWRGTIEQLRLDLFNGPNLVEPSGPLQVGWMQLIEN